METHIVRSLCLQLVLRRFLPMAIGCMILAEPCRPHTIHVPADYASIQLAVNNASQHDTILVAPGTYSGVATFGGKSVKLLSSHGPESTIIQPPAKGSPAIRLINGEDSTTQISGFTFMGGTCVYVIETDNQAYPTISHNVFRDYLGTGDAYLNGSVVLRIKSNAIVANNLFYSNSSPCVIAISKFGTATIINNTLDRNGGGAICIETGRGYIKNNIITNSTSYGVYGGCYGVSYNNVWNNHPNYDDIYNPGPHNLSVDPQFKDTLLHDYGLQPSSPCIDVGDPDPQYDDPDGTRNDMGAYPTHCVYPFVLNLNAGNDEFLHLAGHSPVFYWTFLDSFPQQYVYQIEVGTDSDWTVAELWSSGEVMSSDGMGAYQGPPLEDGNTYYARIRLHNGLLWGGWRLQKLYVNIAPTAPGAFYPVGDRTCNLSYTRLWITSGADADGDTLTYQFMLCGDADCDMPVFDTGGVAGQTTYTGTNSIADVILGSRYWWRARTFDGHEYSDWTPIDSFIVRGIGAVHVPEDVPTIPLGIQVAGRYDTVAVAPGEYPNLYIDFQGKEVKVIGAGVGESVLNAAAGGVGAHFYVGRGEGPETQFSGFTVTGGTGYRVFDVAWGSKIRIEENEFRDCDGTVIVVRGRGHATIRHNLFRQNIRGGFMGSYCIAVDSATWIDGPGTAVILNNTFDGNRYGIKSHGSSVVAMNNAITNAVSDGVIGAFEILDYNNVWNCHANYLWATPGIHDISVDPLYADPANGNYTLSDGSPCIDAGAPDYDFRDQDGTRNDVGAFPRLRDFPLGAGFGIPAEEAEHVVNHTPVLCWSFLDSVGYQVGYEIQVGSDTGWTGPKMWETGMILSPDTAAIYAGRPLIDGSFYTARIRVSNGVKWGGWMEYRFRMNMPPEPPGPLFPVSDDIISVKTVRLWVGNAMDTEGDSLTYEFEICSDAEMTQVVKSVGGIAEMADSTQSGLIEDLSPYTRFWWRSRAYDGHEYSAWSDTHTFVTRAAVGIRVPMLYASIQGAINAAVDGDSVLVAEGVYYENINYLGKSVHVIGSGPDKTTLMPLNTGAAAVTFANREKPEAQLSGFTITGGTGLKMIDISNYANPTVSYNVFRDFSSSFRSAVIIRAGGYGTIKNNFFYDNGGSSCISVIDGYQAYIINNTFDHNVSGVNTLYKGYVINNIVTNSTGYGIYGGFTKVDYNCVWNNHPNYDYGVIPGTHDFCHDPAYMNPDNHDYRLRLGSPCIDAGDPNPIYNDPDGTRADLGANFSDMPVAVDDTPEPVPVTFQLEQNFPNPFNATTTIRYSVMRNALVTIEVFNILGQKVRTLVNETMPAGSYEVYWRGDDAGGRPVATGVYLYRLRAGDVVQTKKMLLIK